MSIEKRKSVNNAQINQSKQFNEERYQLIIFRFHIANISWYFACCSMSSSEMFPSSKVLLSSLKTKVSFSDNTSEHPERTSVSSPDMHRLRDPEIFSGLCLQFGVLTVKSSVESLILIMLLKWPWSFFRAGISGSCFQYPSTAYLKNLKKFNPKTFCKQ